MATVRLAGVPWDRNTGDDAAAGAGHGAADTAGVQQLQPERLCCAVQ